MGGHPKQIPPEQRAVQQQPHHLSFERRGGPDIICFIGIQHLRAVEASARRSEHTSLSVADVCYRLPVRLQRRQITHTSCPSQPFHWRLWRQTTIACELHQRQAPAAARSLNCEQVRVHVPLLGDVDSPQRAYFSAAGLLADPVMYTMYFLIVQDLTKYLQPVQ